MGVGDMCWDCRVFYVMFSHSSQREKGRESKTIERGLCIDCIAGDSAGGRQGGGLQATL